MIKNIIFDMGGVLVNFTPKEHLRALGFDGDAIDRLTEIVFNSPIWLELDRGTYTNRQAAERYIKAHPEFAHEIALTLNGTYDYMLSVKEDSADFLKQLKKEGFRIYVLSNFSLEGYEYILPRFDFLKYVDEKVISSHVKMIKPDTAIYKHMLEKLDILPEESIFIDDAQANLGPAEVLGIHTVLFTTLDEAEQKVRALINGQ